ncbi:MAG: hypothetical protein AAF677_15980 [Pseudomonadota bacterium]
MTAPGRLALAGLLLGAALLPPAAPADTGWSLRRAASGGQMALAEDRRTGNALFLGCVPGRPEGLPVAGLLLRTPRAPGEGTAAITFYITASRPAATLELRLVPTGERDGFGRTVYALHDAAGPADGEAEARAAARLAGQRSGWTVAELVGPPGALILTLGSAEYESAMARVFAEPSCARARSRLEP